jgi:hypothetical protein
MAMPWAGNSTAKHPQASLTPQGFCPILHRRGFYPQETCGNIWDILIVTTREHYRYLIGRSQIYF